MPTNPGSGIASFYYHTSVSASGNVAAARQVTINRFSRTVSVNLNADLDARADLMTLVPSYVFQSPVLGGQLAVSMMGIYGRNRASVDGTLTASLGSLTTTRTGSISDSVTGVGDLYPQFSLKWNQGVHNYMVYGTGNIPVGAYSPTSLANIGLGHGAIDGGFGYTYFDPTKGHEFSVVSGLTYNFRNAATDYQNGIDWHTDFGAVAVSVQNIFRRRCRLLLLISSPMTAARRHFSTASSRASPAPARRSGSSCRSAICRASSA